MSVEIVFETHSWSEDNDRGVATGWLPGRLSPRGRELAAELGDRRRGGGFAAVLCSDLARAVETARIAFDGAPVPVVPDPRLRECDYGEWNGRPAVEVLAQRAGRLTEPYPGGESWTGAVRRIAPVLDDIAERWDGRRVLVIGHVATRWALDHVVDGAALATLVRADFGWQEGWTYRWTGRPGDAARTVRP